MTRQLPTPPNAAMMRRASAQVRRSVQLAVAAGVIPVPAVDLVVIQRVQLRLIRRLSQIFQVSYSTREAKAILVQVPLVAGSDPSLAAQGAGSVSKWLPAYGLIVGTSSVASLAGFSTHQLGKALSRHLANGGILANFKWPLESEDAAETITVAPPALVSEPETRNASSEIKDAEAVVATEVLTETTPVAPVESVSETIEDNITTPEVAPPIAVVSEPEPVAEAEVLTETTPATPVKIVPETIEETTTTPEVAPPVVVSEPEPVAVITEPETSNTSSAIKNTETVAETEVLTETTPVAPVEIIPEPIAEAKPAAQTVVETTPEVNTVEAELATSMPLTAETVSAETLTVKLTENTRAEVETPALISEPETTATPVSSEHSEPTAPTASTVETPAPTTQRCQKCLFWLIVLLLLTVGVGSWLVLHESSPSQQINDAALRAEPAKTVSATE